MARREILGIVGLLGLKLMKADQGEGRVNAAGCSPGMHSAYLKTPFCFNELNDYVNEKI
jgi:hypothetical protein